jgi:hypothetical protein
MTLDAATDTTPDPAATTMRLADRTPDAVRGVSPKRNPRSAPAHPLDGNPEV